MPSSLTISLAMLLTPPLKRDVPDELGRFGKYGGKFVGAFWNVGPTSHKAYESAGITDRFEY